MKGGNVVLLFALKALHDAGALEGRQVSVILTGDEESAGSPIETSRASMRDAGPAQRRRAGVRGRRRGDGDRRPPRGRLVVAEGQGADRALLGHLRRGLRRRGDLRVGPDPRRVPPRALGAEGPDLQRQPRPRRDHGRPTSRAPAAARPRARATSSPARRTSTATSGSSPTPSATAPWPTMRAIVARNLPEDLGRVRVRGRVPRDGPDPGQLRRPRHARPRQPRPRARARSPRSTRSSGARGTSRSSPRWSTVSTASASTGEALAHPRRVDRPRHDPRPGQAQRPS